MEYYKKHLINKGEELKDKLTVELTEKGDFVKDKLKDAQIKGAEVLKHFLSPEPPPERVIETKPDTFSDRAIHLREDGLVLYLPPNVGGRKVLYFEIVLHRPYTETLPHTYSLFRTPSLDEAEIKFCILKNKLPDFIEICKEMYNLQGIQKIVDAFAEHPSWNLAHLTAHFGLCDLFQDPIINSFLNSTDDETGISPLQVAIKTKNLKTVQALIAMNCSLEHIDYNADSVFHYAANTTRDIILALTQWTIPHCLNTLNKSGYTPLHLACMDNKPECVKALLLAGADVNKTSSGLDADHQPGYVGDFLQSHPNSLNKEDMKMGGTPLHWSFSRQVVEALVDMNCNINALNFDKRTALHVMVIRNQLECVVALLSREADPNIGDCDGNRPIHLAVKHGNSAIVQCLIVFGVDLNVLNNAGHLPRHLIAKEQESMLYYLHAIGAERCAPGTPFCTEGCKYGGSFDGAPPPPIMGPTNREVLDQMLDVNAREVFGAGDARKGRLLCMDGGGIRGLVLVVILLEIERVLKRPIKECFDWIAGTSTGGILTLGIATGKTMKECLCLYFRIKEHTFVGRRPYESEPLENVLKETFGAESVMADIDHPKVMITGVIADRRPVELHLFRNYACASDILQIEHNSPYELPLPPAEQYIWQVGRATGAAPTYFRAFGSYLDGGLIANNPTLDAMSEIHEHHLALKATGREADAVPLAVVVSLGTGLIPVTQIKDIDLYRPSGILDGVKLYTGISTLGSLLVDQATSSDGRVVDRARAWCSTTGVQYFRFNPQLSEEIAMNEVSDEKLCNMLWETKAYMHKNAHIIRKIADLLNRK